MSKLFSVVMILDKDLRIVQASDTLLRHIPRVQDSPLLPDVFEIKRPAGIKTFEDIRNNINPLYLMIARDGSFAVRGQVIAPDSPGGHHLCFLGSPWLSWLHEKNPTLKVQLNDFAPQDAQMDQLFYISTEKRMVEDLEGLNERLQAATEELKASQAEKTAFFAQMSHELRTPLNGVVSALTLLKEEGLIGKAETLVKLAGESSLNLMQVINYVLDVSKLELSQPDPEKIAFDLPEMVASVIGVVRAQAAEKGLDLNSDIDDRLSSAYLGDLSLLRQCLLNLATNAIKFTDQGEVSITVTPAREEGMTLRFVVSDTGIGIATDDQARVFEPFLGVRDTRPVDRGPGTGLGLDIVRRNVQHMGGKLGLTSTLGEGSSFWLELPCEAVAVQAQDMAGPAVETRKRRFSGRVLLVDDTSTNLMLGRMILESVGLDVLCAASGEEAISTVREESPDLVLMDISMPGIDGFEATRQIRTFRGADRMPIIALTAYASSIEREMSKDSGMNGYLTKPIVMEELAETLSKWLPQAEDPRPDSPDHVPDENKASPIEESILEELAGQIGWGNLKMAVSAFLDEVDWRWAALEKTSDKVELAREAHTLASSCRSFGLPSIGEKIACIERHAKFGEGADEPPCLNETGKELRRAAAALEAVMARYPSEG